MVTISGSYLYIFSMTVTFALNGTKENEGIGHVPTFPGSSGLNPQVALWVARLVKSSLPRLCNLLPAPWRWSPCRRSGAFDIFKCWFALVSNFLACVCTVLFFGYSFKEINVRAVVEWIPSKVLGILESFLLRLKNFWHQYYNLHFTDKAAEAPSV